MAERLIVAGIIGIMASAGLIIARITRLEVVIALLMIVGSGVAVWRGVQIASAGAAANAFVLRHPAFYLSGNPVYAFRWHGANWFVASADSARVPRGCSTTSQFMVLEVESDTVVAEWDSQANERLVMGWLALPATPRAGTSLQGRLPQDPRHFSAISCARPGSP